MIKNSIIYSIIFLAILGNFSCRKEWVKPDDIVQKPIDSTSNKINTFEYELKPGIIDVTSKARDLIIDETPDQLIVNRTLDTENLFEVDKIYYHVGFDFTKFKNAYRIKEIKKENDKIIVEKRNLAFVDSYEKYHLINNNPESGKIKTRGDILQNDWNIIFNGKLSTIELKKDTLDVIVNAKVAGIFYAQEISIIAGILINYNLGLKLIKDTEISLQHEIEPSKISKFELNKIEFLGFGAGMHGLNASIGIAMILNAGLDIKGTMTTKLIINKTYENISSLGKGKITKYIKDGIERDTMIIYEVGGSSNPSPELDVTFGIEAKGEITLIGNSGIYIGVLVQAFDKTAFINIVGASIKAKFSFSGEGPIFYHNTAGKNNQNNYLKIGLCGKVTFQVEILTIYFLKKESFNQGISFIYQPNGTAIIKCDLSTEGSDPNIQIDIEAFKKNFPNFFNPVTIFKLSKKDGSDCFFEEKINLYTKFNFADIIYKNGKPYFFYSHTNSDILFISGNSFFIAKIEYDSEIITFRLNANEQISYGNVYYGFIDLTQLSKNFPATAVDKYGKIPLDAKMHLTIFDLNGTKVYEHFDFSNYSKLEMNGQSDTIVLLNSIRKLWTRENIYIDNLPNEKIDTFYGTRMTFDQAFSKGGQSRPEGNCPDGYHIPTLEEWYTILDKYWNKIFDENNISEIKRNTSGLSFKQLGIDMLADNSLSSDKESNGSITTYWVAAPESGESGKEVQKVVIANNNQKVSIEEIPKKNNHRAYCRCIQD